MLGDVGTQLVASAVLVGDGVVLLDRVDGGSEVAARRAHPVVGDLDGELVLRLVLGDLDEVVLIVSVTQLLSLEAVLGVAPLDVDGEQRRVAIAADVSVEASGALIGDDVVRPGLGGEVERVAGELRSVGELVRLGVFRVVLVIPGRCVVLEDAGDLDLNEAVTNVGVVLEGIEGCDEVRRVSISARVEVNTSGLLHLRHKIISPLGVGVAPSPAVAVLALGVKHEQDFELVALLVLHGEGVDDREGVSHGDTALVVGDDLT